MAINQHRGKGGWAPPLATIYREAESESKRQIDSTQDNHTSKAGDPRHTRPLQEPRGPSLGRTGPSSSYSPPPININRWRKPRKELTPRKSRPPNRPKSSEEQNLRSRNNRLPQKDKILSNNNTYQPITTPHRKSKEMTTKAESAPDPKARKLCRITTIFKPQPSANIGNHCTQTAKSRHKQNKNTPEANYLPNRE